MLTLSLLPLLLVTGGFAVPSPRDASNIPASEMALPPNQKQLVNPGTPPKKFVMVAVRVQNFSCQENASFGYSGALAQVYDISNLFDGPEFSNIQNNIFANWITIAGDDPTDPNFVQEIESKFGIDVLGAYYFNANDDGTLSPVMDLRATQGPDTVVVAKITGDIPSPDSTSDADWLEMVAVSGSLASTLFQIDTNGGVELLPGEGCEPGYPPSTTKYTSQMWMF